MSGKSGTSRDVEETRFEDAVFPTGTLAVCLPCRPEALPSCCLSKCELIKIRNISGFTLES